MSTYFPRFVDFVSQMLTDIAMAFNSVQCVAESANRYTTHDMQSSTFFHIFTKHLT